MRKWGFLEVFRSFSQNVITLGQWNYVHRHIRRIIRCMQIMPPMPVFRALFDREKSQHEVKSKLSFQFASDFHCIHLKLLTSLGLLLEAHRKWFLVAILWGPFLPQIGPKARFASILQKDPITLTQNVFLGALRLVLEVCGIWHPPPPPTHTHTHPHTPHSPYFGGFWTPDTSKMGHNAGVHLFRKMFPLDLHETCFKLIGTTLIV